MRARNDSPGEAPPPSPANLPFVEELYFRWLREPASVEEGWRRYFEGLPAVPAAASAPAAWPRRDGGPAPDAAGRLQGRVERLVQDYREHGHLRALLDPLGLERSPSGPMPLEPHGLSERDLDHPVSAPGGDVLPLRRLVERLEETYCRTLGVEVAHLHDAELRQWLERRMERTRNRIGLAPEVKRRLLEKLVQADLFESFLGARFLGAKRFSLEGAEGLVPLLELVVDRAVGHGVRNVVIGMAHRGRLNVLAHVLGKPLRQIFAEFQDRSIIDAGGTGDVKYHLGYAADRETPDGGIHLSLAFNPSHLEWIDTVVQGRVRAKQDRYRDGERRRSLPLLVHGDAAFAGQGIVAESLNMSLLDGYAVGGTLHVVVNNQVGFTTSPRDARSTPYATDVARMLDVPIFHVNGEDLEAVAQAVLLAVDFRQRFHRDAVIDLWCYRRHGHNEGDEPAFTQPVMVRAIERKAPLRRTYGEALVREGAVAAGEPEALERATRARLEEELAAAAALAVGPAPLSMEGAWRGFTGGPIPEGEVATGVEPEVLRHIGRHLTEIPPGFRAHPKIARVLQTRAEMMAGRRPLDWGMAEALALGSLAWQGARVRLAGQDSRRGTFSHRHAVLYDQQTGVPYVPLAHLQEGQAEVEIRDSLLSEAGALGFEYGYSLEAPDALVVWEAQFGDFVNAAQVIVDQFLSSSETKWNRLSGLVLLLPHGLEGQGPEHSSARLERFLDLSVDDNWQVVNLTTPAQLFHALRRQVLAPWRKPLVVMSPKSMLRLPAAGSRLEELSGGAFRAVLPDPDAGDPEAVTRVCLCSGKIFHELAAARAERKAERVALLRLEQLFPLRARELQAELARYPRAAEVAWVQEEPRNMGAWRYADVQVGPLVRPQAAWLGITRPPSSAPASGSHTRHGLEQEALLREALEAPRPARRARG